MSRATCQRATAGAVGLQSPRREVSIFPLAMTPPRKSVSRAAATGDGRTAELPLGSAADAPHGSRPEQVYVRLRDLIVQGLLAPGSRIVETEIAARLGVSRTPVREALQRLQQEGYVMGSPGAQQSRLTVAPLTRDDVYELLNIVGALEGMGARGAALLTHADRRNLIRDLKALNAEFHRAGKTIPIDHGSLYDADERFHRRLVEASAGPRLLALHDAVKPQAERYIRMYISMLTGDIRTSVYEHDIIIAAIEEGRADDAELAIQVNWRHAADRLSKVIAMAGERGSW
jgi:DNA-binding GntR family transcriptional regulator